MPMYAPPDPIVARERLTVLMVQVDSDLALAQESGATVEPNESNVGRLSRMDALQQQASTQFLAVQRRRIVAALDRLDAGTYGRCCECGEAVESERMRRDAMILFCAECQAVRDASS